MNDIYVYGETFPLDFSMCKNCTHLLSRVIVPTDIESFGIDEEMIKDWDIPDDEDIILLQHTCLVLQQDMDYIVKECSHFEDVNNLFKTKPFK